MKWLRDRVFGSPEDRLHRAFCQHADSESLAKLLRHALDRGIGLRLEDTAFREALGRAQAWPADPGLMDFLFVRLQQFLAADPTMPRLADWKTWIDLSRVLNRSLAIRSPRLAAGLVTALVGSPEGQPFSGEDRNLVVNAVAAFALQAVGDQPAAATVDICRAIGLLGSLLHTSHNAEAAQAIEHWWAHVAARPRALDALPDEEAFDAAIRGVGSPNGVAMTTVYSGGSAAPARLLLAGRTPDPVINSWLDDALFAAALSCDAEPTILSTGGAVLSLAPPDGSLGSRGGEPLLSAVLTLGGMGEPTGKAPSLALTSEESLLLVSEVFHRIETSSGLIRATTWDSRDGQDLEDAVRGAFTGPDRQLVCSDPAVRTEGGALHAMPLLGWDRQRQVRDISIRIPYQALGVQRLFELLRAGRTLYVESLIRDAKHRESVARAAKEGHQLKIDEWKSGGEERQQAECKRRPEVPITHQYDFRLGRETRLPRIRRVPRRQYEEEIRPQIVRGAIEFERRFKELSEKLTALSKPGGRADILALKLLIDSAIRQARLPLTAEQFQTDYLRWSAIAGPTIWAHVAAWCSEHGYPLEDLAAANVIFNVRPDGKQSEIVLEPWVMVDLHNYAIEVDPAKGHMRVRSGSRSCSLRESTLASPALGIADTRDLYQKFTAWLERFPYPLAIAKGPDGLVPANVVTAEQRTPILFAFARSLLFAGKWEDARKLVLEIRSADEPAIYFLGALAFLAGTPFLRQRPEFQIAVKTTDEASRSQRECILACDLILSGRDANLFPPECRRFLEQLVAREPAFLGRLLSNRSQAHPLSILQADEPSHPQVEYAKAAAASLELLHLAETTSAAALALSSFGSVSGAVQRTLIDLCDQSERLAFVQASATAGFDELRELLA